MPKNLDIESDTAPMHPHHEHPHIDALKAEFARHKIAFLCAGVVCGVMVAGGISAATGAVTLPKSSSKKEPMSVTVMGGDKANPTSSKGWFTSTKNPEPEPEYCWSCDNAPSRGWGWNWGYGKCHCYENWEGACCDVVTDVYEQDPYGPYMGTPGTYELYTIETKDTAQYMDYADQQGNTKSGTVPIEFQGLWWMDGNPASDYVASFGRSHWETKAEGGCKNGDVLHNDQSGDDIPCLGGLDVNVYDENIWSWHNEDLGRFVYGAVLGVQLTYRFECGGDDAGHVTYCQIYPNAAIPVSQAGSWISVPPDLVSFDMTRASDDLWIRNSIIAGFQDFTHNYYLKQIIKGDGTKGEHWDDYMSHGHAKAPKQADVFGFGEDQRDLVSDVHGNQCLSRKIS